MTGECVNEVLQVQGEKRGVGSDIASSDSRGSSQEIMHSGCRVCPCSAKTYKSKYCSGNM